MAQPKKMALLRMTAEAFRQLLDLPEDAEVVRIEVAKGYRGSLDIVVEGAGWPVAEGGPIQPTSGHSWQQVDAEGQLVKWRMDWGFPEEVAGCDPASNDEAAAPQH